MDFILEVVRIINTHRVQRVEILGEHYGEKSKYSQLYQGIKEGKISSDKDAATLLYDGDVNNLNYKKFKFRFRQRLIDTLFFIDTNAPNFTDIQSAYYNCYKNWAAIRILFGKSAKRSAVILAEKLLRQALKFEFTEIILNLSRVLRLHYATVIGSKRKFKVYDELLKSQLFILEAETKVEELYEDLLIEFVNSRATKGGFSEKAQQYIDELSPYLGKVNTFNFIFFSHTIMVLRYEIINDHNNVVEKCLEAISALQLKPFTLKGQFFPFLFKILSAYLKMGRYEEIPSIAQKCTQVIDEGTINWFKFHQVYFQYLLHIEEYEEALIVLEKITLHPRLKFQSQDTRENWKIFSAYMYFLSSLGLIADDKFSKKNKRMFRLGKFLNEVPAFTKDKRGFNISILIIQVLVFLCDKKYNAIFDRINALERYSTRYLRRNDTFRSNCFIKMLILIPKGHFNRMAVERHTENYSKQLKSMPLSQANQSSEIEIIPYDRLWEYILRLLD
ncbi:MAG: hypothetical protein AAGG75_02725 [Bacteroidota bacterium]